MKVIYDIGKFNQKIVRPVVAIGVFDGLHVGHQKILRHMMERARAIDGQSVVFTFFPHPAHVLNPKNHLKFLTTLEHRLQLIQDMGVDLCFVTQFTFQFASLNPQEFIDRYLIKRIHPREVFVGYNFHFGHDRKGNPELLKRLGAKHGFKVHVVPRIRLNSSLVSSTRIRHLLREGKLNLSEKLLGRKFSVLGQVKKGDQRGRTLGFPTANLIPTGVVLPPKGVYIVEVLWKKKLWHGIANLGECPSFNRVAFSIRLEVYLFDFSRNLYNQEIEVRFIQKLRNEKKFISPESLILQIQKDIIQGRKFFPLLKH